MQSNYKFIHLCHHEKFIPAFVRFINNEFKEEEHLFVILGGDEKKYFISKEKNIVILPSKLSSLRYIFKLNRILNGFVKHSNKVFLHGLFEVYYLNFLLLNFFRLRRFVWLIWGGDLYDYQKRKYITRGFLNIFKKKFIVPKFGLISSDVPGDYVLSKKWYGAKGKYLHCHLYESNVFEKTQNDRLETAGPLKIMLGNSADPSNNHFEVLDKFYALFVKENLIDFRIYCPLSYGNQRHRENVIIRGQQLFGDKFIPLLDYMSYNQYLKFLEQIDIAVFNHDRQQALGNIIQLVGIGCKVYIKNTTTIWEYLKNLEIKIFDFTELEFSKIKKSDKLTNNNLAANFFSKQTLVKQWKELLTCKL